MKFGSLMLLGASIGLLLRGCNSRHEQKESQNAPVVKGDWDYNVESTWTGDCKSGTHQSPIDIPANLAAQKPVAPQAGGSIVESLTLLRGSLRNNGHTVLEDVAEPFPNVELEGDSYQLKTFHFHAPSEHKVGGVAFPLEMHFVHKDKEGHLLVVGVLFKEGKENEILQTLLKEAPEKQSMEARTAPAVDVASLIPKGAAYYRYDGSLTTPPCTEGVRWFVKEEPAEVSPEQVAHYRHLMHDEPTNRPVQPLNDRVVLP